mmetsp:Transcript_11901/g.38920  ORF Transcript_11901/g.38920 Transcript_11901/m.38920 type:complete len:158 (-) Transcript_11901:61-534(-)
MLNRAYRPSHAAQGALRVTLGLSQSAIGDHAAALRSHQQALAQLTSPPAIAAHAPPMWSLAARVGAIAAAASLGDAQTARGLADEALAASSGAPVGTDGGEVSREAIRAVVAMAEAAADQPASAPAAPWLPALGAGVALDGYALQQAEVGDAGKRDE